MTIKQSTEFNVSIPFKSTTIGLVERASVKYCGRRSAILTRDAQVLSSKFTRTDRRSMNPGFVADKSVRQRRVAPDLQLDCQRTIPSTIVATNHGNDWTTISISKQYASKRVVKFHQRMGLSIFRCNRWFPPFPFH